MIFDGIISIVFGFIKLVLSPLPAIPETPEVVLEGSEWVVDTIASVAGFLEVLYSAPLLAAITVMLVALLAFDQIYWFVHWLVKKLPFLNIK